MLIIAVVGGGFYSGGRDQHSCRIINRLVFSVARQRFLQFIQFQQNPKIFEFQEKRSFLNIQIFEDAMQQENTEKQSAQ